MSAQQSPTSVPEPRRSRFLSVMSRWPLSRFFDRAEQLRKRILRRRAETSVDRSERTEFIYAEERFWVARRESGLSARLVRRHNLDTVVAILEHNSIPYFAVPDEALRHTAIGIEDHHWTAFATALQAERSNVPLYLGVEFTAEDGRKVRGSVNTDSDKARMALSSQSYFEIFQFFTGAGPSKVYGRSDACRVERWVRDAEGTLTAPRDNNRAAVIAESLQATAEVSVFGADLPTLVPLAETGPFEFRKPIDIVYLWVDGQDVDWRKRRDAVITQLTGKVPEASYDPSRFRDNGELRYSMRSVFQHCDWVRNIILVTDDQVPEWLDVTHPRIRVVHHEELFGPAGSLPTFNSHAITSRVHHIKDLSETYLIMNDDVFIGHDVGPGRFFHANGIGKFFLSQTTLPRLSSFPLPHEAARENTIRLIESEYGVRPSRIFCHAPVPQLKSHLFALEERYPEQFRVTQSNQLRSPDDYQINSWMHHYVGYLDGRMVPASIPYSYFNLGDPNAVSRMKTLLRNRWAATFCLNDSPRATRETLDYVPSWLENYYPLPAPWERQ